MTTRIATLRHIAATKQPRPLRWQEGRATFSRTIDVLEAYLLAAAYNALRTDSQRLAFERAPLPHLIDFAWKHATVVL